MKTPARFRRLKPLKHYYSYGIRRQLLAYLDINEPTTQLSHPQPDHFVSLREISFWWQKYFTC